ncbi:glycoside hydrolase family 2 protein [Lacibacter sp.]|uniref:glycoside hydrolase family 2 protein n=1 Tax=Lacibacter sp. TaxID=1915409 RepID=UPI002B4B13D2|nr:glycoside hydrolase family 2 TIM barrel-domain containing protein [Lacibacter sp.]HLP38068.1 glycoside hydrolase family 2 TIM barrel-domain containing protein [Lacibacter sp.]
MRVKIWQLVVVISCLLLDAGALYAQQTAIHYLSGKDKDNTVNWEFFCTGGMNSGKWTTIPVPSNWELKNFGAYNYGHDEKGNAKKKSTEQGLYKHRFIADKAWANKQIEIVFEGVMTDAEVKVNGQLVGPIHQGGFYRFQYNITNFIKPGAENLLEVTVSKVSADKTVNNAEREGDFWVFGGIYRPVYLKILPASFIQRVAIDAKADGKFTMDVYAEQAKTGDEITAQVKTLKGVAVGKAFSATVTNPTDKIQLSNSFTNPKQWNAEFPNLYKVEVSIRRKGKVVHVYHERFGFRTVEVRKGDGIYVNGVKIMMKGVNRHSIWPESGRTLSRKIHLKDIELIKDMNMNAVRMSHYPPDPEFLDLCDSLGLFVLDELTGWQNKYGTPVGEKLVKELVIRDVNHPSILFWDNGNEGGWNTDLDDDYALYDPQQRVVLHPWSNFNNVDTKHYPDYSYVEKSAEKGDVLLHTEMIHGLYDGGHGAGLDDYWKLFRKNPRHAGGFLWVLADEAVVRKDLNDSLDTDGNHAPDGIVGPHHEKEGSYYTIKEIWSPVQVAKPTLDKNFTGKLSVENNYHYTNLSTCKFSWQLIKFPLAKEKKTGHAVITSGKTSIALAAGKTGTLQIALPANWMNADALSFTATDQYGRELYTWTWPIQQPASIANINLATTKKPATPIKESTEGKTISILCDGISYRFDTTTGCLTTVTKNQQLIPFGNGPVIADGKQTLQKFTHAKQGSNTYVVEAEYAGDASLNVKWTFTSGSPAKLEYSYTQSVAADFYGITFNVDESKLKGMKWLGAGPYRVWKNRLKGAPLNVWQKKYNKAITGEVISYPEFSGYHGNVYWVSVETASSSFTVYTDKEDLFVQMLKPQKASTTFIPHVNPPFPEGNFGFLNAIAPIGTKFRAANTMGPQSQKNDPVPGRVNGRLWFEF